MPQQSRSEKERCPFTQTQACDSCPAIIAEREQFTSAELISLADTLARKVNISYSICKHLSVNPNNKLYAAIAWKERIHLYQEIDSTNTLARSLLQKAIQENNLHYSNGTLTNQACSIQGTIVLANHQTDGRGRQGRSFFSPQATGLYLSTIIIPPGGVKNPAQLTASAAVAVCKALEQVYQIQPAIKWVNDIFYKGKKIGGILTEGVMDTSDGTIPGAVVGIGLNITPPDKGFPPELESIAGAIFSNTTDRNFEENNSQRNDLISAIMQNIFHALEKQWRQGDRPQEIDTVMEEYRQRSLLKPGHKVRVFPLAGSTQDSYPATCLGIDSNARLQIQMEDGKYKLLDSGEVSLQSQEFTN